MRGASGRFWDICQVPRGILIGSHSPLLWSPSAVLHFETRLFEYDPRSHRGDRSPRRPDFSTRGSHTHLETWHLDGSHFPHCVSRPTQPNGEMERIVKTSSDRMVTCKISKIYLTNPSTEPSTLLVLCRWWMEVWRTHGSWIPVAHISWPESLYVSPTSPTCFRVFDFCGIWLVAFLCVWLVLVVITFFIAWTLMSPSWDLMDYLTPFHVGWDEFVNMLIELMTEPHRGGFIARMNLSDSQWSENTINTHKYNTIYWRSSKFY
jgi:hypothetical protein